jgi:hypothetical protein
LTILSNLRNLQTEIIKQLSTMSIAYEPRLLKYDVLSVEYIAKITKVNVKYVLDIQNDMKMKKG